MGKSLISIYCVGVSQSGEKWFAHELAFYYLSCHHVVLFIKTSRDYAPNYPVSFERLGTDVCEEYFSANGSFIVNKHNYTMMDIYRNLGDMNRRQIFSDEQGPNNPKQHRKGENIWRKGHQHQIPNQFDQPDLNDFPNDKEMIGTLVLKKLRLA